MAIRRIKTNQRLSRAVVVNGIVQLAGTTALDRKQDIHGQIRQVFARIEEDLADAGSDKSKLVSAWVILKDVKRDFAALNEAWEAWIPAGCAPARATWQADLE